MAYIDILSGHVLMPHHTLTKRDLQRIGEFSRENITRWLDIHVPKDALVPGQDLNFDLQVYGWEDFHAVCGDIEIDWAKEESKRVWRGINND